MKLSSLLVIGTTEALKCQVCEQTYDSVGDLIGAGQEGCFYGEQDYLTECPRDDDICTIESVIDWLPRGNHIYKLERKCAPKIPEQEAPCLLVMSGLTNFKDCRYQCNTDNCNNGNDEIDDLTTSGGKDHEKHCNICSYYQDIATGTEQGTKDCGSTLTPSNKYTKQCPRYADAGCADSASYHKGYEGEFEGQQFEDFFRACTPFKFAETEESWSKCETIEVAGINHLSCKSTCEDDNCNNEEHQIKSQCYTCTGTRDGAGRNVGNSDDRCWENLQAEMLADCDVDEVCYDDMNIDWLINGHYIRTIKRGCVKPEQIGADEWEDGTNCYGGSLSSGHFQYKDCQKVCEGSICNDDLSVGDLFSSKSEGASPQMCQQCAYLEFENGNRDGIPACLNSADPNRLVECPSFADNGCYTSTNTQITDNGENFNQVERGCSTFGIEDGVNPGLDCYDTAEILDEDQNFAVCKDYCVNNNCNNKQPVLPNQSGSSWPSCVTCQVYFNDNEEILGIGNEMDCRGEWDRPGPNGEYVMSAEAVAKYAQRCPSKGDYCLTDMEVDWLPRGDITYRVTRGCSSKPQTEKCTGASSSLIQYRDCQHDCTPSKDGNDCNNDLAEISRKMNDGRNHVSQCVKCSYTQDADGNVIGDPNCPLVPDLGAEDLDELTYWCPAYARVACATAASFHSTYGDDEQEIIEDYRHCSPFDSFPETDCVFQTINGLDHLNCKNTCRSGDNCNTERIERGNQCYACTATIDAFGNPIGIGDSDCWDTDKLHKNMLTDCRPEQTYCATEMVADWQPMGDQVYRIIRGCSEEPAQEQCDRGSNSLLKFKDCYTSCENKDGPCNTNNDVFEKMSDGSVKECITCYWEEQDNGNVSGNRKCDGPVDESFSEPCPRYAQDGCFTGAAVHQDYGRDFRQIYKGCSSFKVNLIGDEHGEEKDMVSLPDDSGNIARYSLSKTSCGEPNCNTEHLEPDSPGNAAGSMCQVCNVVVDQWNKTVGIGNKDCWEGGNADFLQDCGVGAYCSTDLEIDWLPRGSHQFRMVRGCTTTPPSYDEPCDEGSSRNGKYKDCRVSCDPRVEGNGCNNELEKVSEKFATTVWMSQCYACEHYEDLDGNMFGNKKCSKMQLDPNGFAGAMYCPKYAHASCYTATSYHVDYNNPDAPIQGNSFEDYFRGCSPFTEHNGDWWGKHCEQASINGFEHENCKELCFGPYCNFAARDPKPQCHTCSVTLDSEGNAVGTSDPNCLMDLTGSNANVQECAPNQPYCTDIMEIDWYGRGMQYVHFNRGCTREPAENQCIDLTDLLDANIRAKLCTSRSCQPTDGPCNKDLSVTNNFLPITGDGVKSCTTCSYSENDDGTVSGNINCGENATDEMSMECEPWLSTGCYVASASHQQVGTDRYETYKGCSYFATDGVERSDDFIGGVAYKTVKESCSGDDCNKDKYNKP